MKKIFPIIVAIGTGLLLLAGLIFRPLLNPILTPLLQLGIILGSMATLVGILNLLLTHWRKIITGKRGFFFSLIVLFSFAISFAGGILLGTDDSGYMRWIASIQIPLEVSLFALLAVTMTFAGIQFFRMRGWSPLSIAFGISTLLFLIISTGLFQSLENPVLDQMIAFIQRLPLAGTRGILIGIALGMFLTGMRVLFGIDRPYGE